MTDFDPDSSIDPNASTPERTAAAMGSDPSGSMLTGAAAASLLGAGEVAGAGEGAGSGVLGHALQHSGMLTGAALFHQMSRGGTRKDENGNTVRVPGMGMKEMLTNPAQTIGQMRWALRNPGMPLMATLFNSTLKSGPGTIAKAGLSMIFSPNSLVIPGQQAGGKDRSGPFGLPMFSAAAQAGFGQDYRAFLMSYAGGNPNYSYAQALQAQQTIAASGYWGDNANFLAGQMRTLYQNAQLSPEQVMSFYDPLMRNGGSTDVLQQQLAQLAQAAKAAHIGLSQFGGSLATTAQQVTAQTGVVDPAGALEALSAVTRADPSQLQGLMTGNNLIMGASLTGQNFGDLMFNQHSRLAEASMALPDAIFGGLTGHMSFNQFRQLPGDQQAVIKNRLAYAYTSNPNIFGGLSPMQMFDQWAKGINVARRAQGFQDIAGSATQGQFMHAIREFGGPASHSLATAFLDKHYDLSKASGVKDAQKMLTARMSKILDAQNNNAANAVTITLDPQARKLFKLLGGDKSSSNHSHSGWRMALNLGGDAVGITAGALIGGVPGAMAGLAGANAIEGMVG